MRNLIETKKQKRRSAILAELTRLSRDGWQNAKPYDYEPLERELQDIDSN